MSLFLPQRPPGPVSSPRRTLTIRSIGCFVVRAPCLGIVAVIDLYRRFLSPYLGENCRFHPSCSSYARQALLTHGLAAGLMLAIWRVVRCQPLSVGGFDPVPKENPFRRALSRICGSQAKPSQAS